MRCDLRPVRSGPREADCPLCALSIGELENFWLELLRRGEAWVRDPAGGFRRYSREHISEANGRLVGPHLN